MKKLLTFFLHIMMNICAHTLCAQTSAIDSLLNVLKTAKEDTNKVNTLSDLSERLRDIREYSKSLQYDDTALALSHKLNFKTGTAFSYNSIGMTYMQKRDYAEALKYFQTALKLNEEIGDKRKISNVYHNIAVSNRNLGNMPEALKNHLAALRMREVIGDKNMIAHSYLSISALYGYQENYEEALKYSLAALDGFKESGKRESMALAYINIALTYTRLNKYQEAIDNLFLGLKINEELGKKELVASNYSNLSNIYGSFGNYEEGLKYALIAIKILEETGEDMNALTSAYINAGAALVKLAASEKNKEEADKKLGQALQYFNNALQTTKASGNKERIKNAYHGLYSVYFAQDNFQQALENYTQFTLYKDSLLNEKSNKQTEQLKIQYETEKKDKEIEIKTLEVKQKEVLLLASKLEAQTKQNEIVILNTNNEVRELQLTEAERKLAQQKAEAEVISKDKQLKEQQLEKQKLLRNGLIVGTFLLVLVGVFVFRSLQLRRKLEKQQAIAQERKRISADLHDEIGSTLSSINILSGMAGSKLDTDKEKTRDIISRINTDAKRTHESMYDIIWEVKPENDSLEKVVARMREYASEILEAKNIRLQFPRSEALKTTDIDPVKRHTLYLIFKEAVNNIAKYSGATEANVLLTRNNGSLHLAIEDNGKGFSDGSVVYGNGIKNMKQRSENVHATFALNTAPGKGTSVTLVLPIP